MKLTGSQILEVVDALPRLADHLIMKGLATKALHVARVRQAMQAESSAIIEVRSALIAKYGKAGEQGQRIVTFGTPEYDSFVEELAPITGKVYDLDLERLSLSGKELKGLPGIVFLATSPILEVYDD